MLRDITLGQYYPADSVIHKLDPRVKLFATFIYIISLFCFKGIAALLFATVFLIFCIRTSKVPFKFMVKGLKAIVVLMLITAAFNLFLTPGTPIVKFWIFKITAEGAQNAILMAARLLPQRIVLHRSFPRSFLIHVRYNLCCLPHFISAGKNARTKTARCLNSFSHFVIPAGNPMRILPLFYHSAQRIPFQLYPCIRIFRPDI